MLSIRDIAQLVGNDFGFANLRVDVAVRVAVMIYLNLQAFHIIQYVIYPAVIINCTLNFFLNIWPLAQR